LEQPPNCGRLEGANHHAGRANFTAFCIGKDFFVYDKKEEFEEHFPFLRLGAVVTILK